MSVYAEPFYSGEELSVSPSLELIFSINSINEFEIFWGNLEGYLVSLDFIHYNSDSVVIISHDRLQVADEQIINKRNFICFIKEIRAAGEHVIRQKQIMLRVCNYEEGTCNYTHGITISMSRSFFSDDPSVISLQFTTTINDNWKYLEGILSDIVSLESDFFSWASLGYRFVINPNYFYRGAEKMKQKCMRYIGVDLDDSLCSHNEIWKDRIRTINWKTIIKNADGIKFYQTGEKPSVCDRNSLDLASLKEYKVMDEYLTIYKFNSDGVYWLNYRDEDFLSTWNSRWETIRLT
ncbi:DUF3396 domain-containing protein [Salmonella enterica subsp. salamae]|nr:DUF3396 domain-containing protein [Salmonella enterica subsp. salamae]